MTNFIIAAIDRNRTVLMLMVLALIVGIVTLQVIPKESNPDITVPQVYVSVSHEGISPEDADSLIYKPLEKKLRGIDGLKEMIATSTFGRVTLQLEFLSDSDIDQALDDVRRKVDEAKGEFPEESKEPVVKEINVALFPVMVVTLSGLVDEATMYATAESLQTKIEAIPGVLEASITGKREEIAEIIIDPVRVDQYQITLQEIAQTVANNTQLISSGSLDNNAGRFDIKVPGLIEDIPDILRLPIKSTSDHVVLFEDMAVGRLSYKDRTSSASMNGERAVVLEIKKRIGSNIIETLDQVRQIVAEAQPLLPDGLQVTISQDESKSIRNMLSDLINNVVFSTLLVVLVILAFLGFRSSLLVGLAIPGAFLLGVIAINMMGYTLNMVVLFGLILSIGMLVDGAIVVTEYADRQLALGKTPKIAYRLAGSHMAWPIIASTATTLAVFLPLLFWPDTTGEFMKYLPITLIFTLSASLIMALIVIPALGSIITRKATSSTRQLEVTDAIEQGDFSKTTGFTALYVKLLRAVINRPATVTIVMLSFLVVTVLVYSNHGRGTEFFPEVDADIALIDIRARGNLSMQERSQIVNRVEKRIYDMVEIDNIYSTAMIRPPQDAAADLIGRIQLELRDWQQRRTANEILSDIEQRTNDIPGIVLELQKKQNGPADGYDIELELISSNSDAIPPLVNDVIELLKSDDELKDLRSTLPLEEIDWQFTIDREKANQFGADMSSTGALIRMVTGGQIVGQFQPEFTDEEVDIVLRYPKLQRNLDQFETLNIVTAAGVVPVTNFMEQTPVAKKGDIVRRDGFYQYRILANVHDGVNANAKIREIGDLLTTINWQDAGVQPNFRGDFEKQARTGRFLVSAFAIAIFLMATILVTQFNSFYQAALIMSAIVLSITGVLMGLLITREPFGIVMSGVGVIALAGIVVNNNIVLIDTYNRMIQKGIAPADAALRTGVQRLRPVLLTAATTVIGLLPMVLQWNIDLIDQQVTVGAPSSQWWTQLSTAIAGGLTFATVLTLLLTPCLLVVGQKLRRSRTDSEPSELTPKVIS